MAEVLHEHAWHTHDVAVARLLCARSADATSVALSAVDSPSKKPQVFSGGPYRCCLVEPARCADGPSVAGLVEARHCAMSSDPVHLIITAHLGLLLVGLQPNRHRQRPGQALAAATDLESCEGPVCWARCMDGDF
jgi:hypothetical protein